MTEDNKNFGKKPVRRSKTEEKEPARVYRPRTMRWAPKASNDTDANPMSEAPQEEAEKPKRSPRPERFTESDERPKRSQFGDSNRKGFDKDKDSGKGKRGSFDREEKRAKAEPEAFNYTESKKSTYNPDEFVEDWEKNPRPSRERGREGFGSKEGFKPKKEFGRKSFDRPAGSEGGERRFTRSKPEGSRYSDERKPRFDGGSDRKPFRKTDERGERYPKSNDKGFFSERKSRREDGEGKPRTYGDRYPKSNEKGYSSEQRGKREDGEGKPRTYGDKYPKSNDKGFSSERRGRRDEGEGKSRSYSDRPSKPRFDKERSTEKPRERRYPKREEVSGKHRDVGFRKAKGSLYSAPQIDAELKTDSDGLIRLNKYIANSGLCSRREADDYIAKGMITVNGQVVDQLGAKIKLTDEVQFKGNKLDPERKVYILLNKPKDYVTTVEDPNAKFTVMDLIEGACDQRVYPVGRLDRNSTGLLLLTNDGELTTKLTHPSFEKKKVYEVGLDRNLSPNDMETLTKGVTLDDGEVAFADAVAYIDESDKSEIGIEIHTGQNRVVRRMFESLGYKVSKLDRVYYAGLTKKNLPRGKWRFLDESEIRMLKMNRFE